MVSCLLNSKNPDDLVMPSIVVHKLAWYPDYSPWCVHGCSTPCPTSLSPSLSHFFQAPPPSQKHPTWHYTPAHTPVPPATNPFPNQPQRHTPTPTPTLHHTALHCTTLHHTASHTRKGNGSRARSTIAILVITRLCVTIGTTMLLLCKHRITMVTGVWPYIIV